MALVKIFYIVLRVTIIRIKVFLGDQGCHPWFGIFGNQFRFFIHFNRVFMKLFLARIIYLNVVNNHFVITLTPPTATNSLPTALPHSPRLLLRTMTSQFHFLALFENGILGRLRLGRHWEDGLLFHHFRLPPQPCTAIFARHRRHMRPLIIIIVITGSFLRFIKFRSIRIRQEFLFYFDLGLLGVEGLRGGWRLLSLRLGIWVGLGFILNRVSCYWLVFLEVFNNLFCCLRHYFNLFWKKMK